MLEKLKNWFKGEKPTDKSIDDIALQAQPIEINPTAPVALTRREARLGRLLTITDPSDEIKAEIKRLQEKI